MRLDTALSLLLVFLICSMFPLISMGTSYGTIENHLKKHDTKPLTSKIQSSVLRETNEQRASADSAKRLSTEEESIQVVLEIDDNNADKMTKIGQNSVIETVHKDYVQAHVLPSNLEKLSDLPFVKVIRKPNVAMPDLISEGVQVISSSITNTVGSTGKGVKVAVIDRGFDINNPEISSHIIEASSFRADGEIASDNSSDRNHGTAVSEIIVDVAPDVELMVYTIDTDIEFLNAIDHIMDEGQAKIISMSLGFFNDGPYDGSSPISQAISDAHNNGILIVNSAGNYATQHWSGTFFDADSDGIENFEGADETINISVISGETIGIYLSWDDNWDTSVNDYDLYLYDNALNPLDASINSQDGSFGSHPAEQITDVAPYSGIYHIVIEKYNASEPSEFDIFTTIPLDEYSVSAGSIANIADALGAFTVGAFNWETSKIEDFSSRGPTDDGRIKPDIAGPDGVATSALNPFYGTSAAAPYVAGVAALVKAAVPSANADTLQSLVEGNTYPNHDKDNQEGTGFLNALFLANMKYTLTKNISKNSTPSSQPAIATSDDEVYLAWKDNGTDSDNIYFKRSVNDGASFETTKKLSNSEGTLSNPRIANIDDSVFVVWEDLATGNGDIYFRMSDDGGSTFGDVINMSRNIGTSSNAQIAVSGSNVYVVWQDTSSGNKEIFIKMSSDGGATFAPSRNLSKNSGISINPQIALAGTNIYVVWQDNTDGDDDIYLRYSTDDGATFTHTRNLSSNTGISTNPQIALAGTNIYVVWQDNTSGNYEISLKMSTNGGSNFNPSRNLSKNAGTSIQPAISAEDDTLVLAWEDNTKGNYEVYFRAGTDSGLTFGHAKNLSTNAGDSTKAQVVLSFGQVFVTWEDATNAARNGDIYFITSTDGGFNFSSLQNLSRNTGISSNVKIATSIFFIFVAWQDTSAGNGDTYLRQAFY